MKQTFRPLLLPVLLLAACQPQTPSNKSEATAASSASTTTPVSTPASASAQTDTAALLQTADLSSLWANSIDGQPAKAAMDGFYGNDNYHIAFYFDSVRRDVRQPTQYHIWGRERFKRVTTAFSGTCVVTRLVPLPDTAALIDSRSLRAYTAVSTFELREDQAAAGAGTHSGKAYLDFCVDADGRPQPCQFEGIDTGTGNPTKGSGLLFRGTWRSNRTGQTKPVAWAGWYEAVVPDALRKLGLGERGAEVSPKLAQYGWGETWQNDEWWAASPKPSLSL